MKRILITGKNSYVGNSFEKWLENYPGKYEVDKISVRDDSWKDRDFSSYDSVLHVAGIAHRKETKKNQHLYYEVNRDLAYEVAKKAKNDGVTHFVFLSSMSIYGVVDGVIDQDTPINPKSNYGKSKSEAENLIQSLSQKKFKVAILRPPMIYGRGCRGNYPKLVKVALKTPVFPAISNKRSMIYIDNLCEYIRLTIDTYSNKVSHPQNEEYICTADLVEKVAAAHAKKIIFIKILNPIIKSLKLGVVNKVFGDLIYAKDIDSTSYEHIIYDFDKTITLTEKTGE